MLTIKLQCHQKQYSVVSIIQCTEDLELQLRCHKRLLPPTFFWETELQHEGL